jgi:hypothetical protein
MTRFFDRQRGAATVVTVALLTWCLALVVAYTSRVIVTSQRLAGNDAAARAGLEAAQAGLEAALTGLITMDPTGIAYDGNGSTSFRGPAKTLANGASYETRIGNDGLLPFRADLLEIESTGTAPGGGRRVVRQLARLQPWLPEVIPAPLVVRGSAAFAELHLANLERPIAAWVGSGLEAASMTAELAEPPRCGPQGICENDARIGGLTPDEFFEGLLGRRPELLKTLSRRITCTPCDGNLGGEQGPVLWLEATDGEAVVLGGAVGSSDHPVLTIVDGDLRLITDTVTYGLLYVRGSWLGGEGGFFAHGSMLVEKDIAPPGRPSSLRYEPAALQALAARGPYARVAGTWADF